MGITVESQTVAALVNVSKCNLQSAFVSCSRPDRNPAKGISNLQNDFLDHIRPLKSMFFTGKMHNIGKTAFPNPKPP